MITQIKDAPTASRSGRPKPRFSSGTIRIPPPRPRSEPKTPATSPPPTMSRPTAMSGPAHAARPDQRGDLGTQVLGRVGQKRDVARSLERHGQLALVPGA